MSGPARHGLSRKTPFRVLRVGHGGPVRQPPGVPTAHRHRVERDHRGLKRKSGGTQEHAASAPYCCETARTDREGRTSHGWRVWLSRRTDRWLRALRQNEASHPRRQMWPNWQATTSATKPPSPGWVRPDLDLSDRSNGKAPLPSGICQPWQEDRCSAKRAERGAARCHFIDYPTRQLTAPRPNTHGREWLWTLIEGHTTGRCCRVNGKACLSGGRGF